MELQDRRRNLGGAEGEEGLGGRTGQGRDRPHRAARRQDQRDLRARFRPCAGGGARCGCGTRARREQAAARHSAHRQGILQHGRPAHDLWHAGTEGFHRQRGRAGDHAHQGCRRRHCRQDQRAARARRLAELQRHLRHHQQSLRSRANAGRLVRRLIGRARGGLWAALDRLRHRRLVARAGVSLRRLRAQADLWTGRQSRAYRAAIAAAPFQSRPLRDRTDGARRRRSHAAARRDGRSRPAGSRHSLQARIAGSAPYCAEGFSRSRDRKRSPAADRQGRARLHRGTRWQAWQGRRQCRAGEPTAARLRGLVANLHAPPACADGCKPAGRCPGAGKDSRR